jgi:hypothetical protein
MTIKIYFIVLTASLGKTPFGWDWWRRRSTAQKLVLAHDRGG